MEGLHHIALSSQKVPQDNHHVVVLFLIYNKDNNAVIQFHMSIYHVAYIYTMLEIDIRTGNRSNILDYGQKLAQKRFNEGFTSEEVIKAISFHADIIVSYLLNHPDLKNMEQRIHDEIMVTIQMLVDKIEDTYESLGQI